jgi:hypothetical protein
MSAQRTRVSGSWVVSGGPASSSEVIALGMFRFAPASAGVRWPLLTSPLPAAEDTSTGAARCPPVPAAPAVGELATESTRWLCFEHASATVMNKVSFTD